jgi:ABC-type uncharacterized transport system ATPase subunit/ABC-type uncharacterized transport system permease subunit
MAKPLLEFRSITKAFGQNLANDAISMTVLPGRVHAIVGENGAGKTTLMTMIAGTAQPDSGEIHYDGRRVRITNPQRAAALGIGMVHQHFKLVPSLTVAANIFLGRELRTRRGTLDTAKMEARVAELSEQFGLAIDPQVQVASLSVGIRQRVEVLKALSHDTRLLILDEPTAVLTPKETDELFVVVRGLANKGCAVLFISHKLGEVLSIADEVTVIRDGRTINSRPAAGLSQADIAQMMVGREVLLRVQHTEAKAAEQVLEVDQLEVIDDRGVTVVDRLSLQVRAGEIVGIAGVEGNGQTELAAAIAGMQAVQRGHVRMDGEDITRANVETRRRKGLAYIPEDRNEVGTGPGLPITENLVPTHLGRPVSRWGWISARGAATFSRRLISTFDVRGARADTKVSTLSGGNVQKVVIAREFEANPKLLMVSQPTRGVDVGAMEFVHNAIVTQRDAGAAVLLLSADLNEVMSLSDRLLVMYRGAIIAEFTQRNMSEAAVGLAMAGTAPSHDDVRRAEQAHASTASKVNTTDTVIVPPTKTQGPGAPAPEADAGVEPSEPVSQFWVPRALGLLRRSAKGWVQPLIAVAVSLVIGAVIILLLGENPITAYNELFFSNFRAAFSIGGFIAQFIPLLVLAGAVIVSFRAGFFNIGGEGQLFMGAFFGAFAGFTFTELPPLLVIFLVLVFGFIGGLLWGAIPGALFAFWKVSIIVTTLMLSTIATLFTAYLVTGPFKDPTAGLAASPKLAEGVRFTMFNAAYGIGWDLVVAVVIFVAVALILTRSVWGLRVRQLGEMNRFAEYTGVNPKKMSIQVMALSGAVSGLAGAIFVLGPNGGRFLQTFSPGYGFLGITVALLARLNPWAAIVAAAFYANMMAGSNAMQLNTDVPYPLVNVLQGLIILSITALFVIDRRNRERILRLLPFLRRGEPAPSAAGDIPTGRTGKDSAPSAGSTRTEYAIPPTSGGAPPPDDPDQPLTSTDVTGDR